MPEDCPYDLTDPKSLPNLVCKKFREAILSLPSSYLSMSEHELCTKVYGRGRPTEVDTKLRIALWREYDRCQRKSFSQIRTEDVVRGVCSRNHFDEQILTSHGKLAFILMEPPEYWTSMEDLLHLSIPEMRRILLLKEVVNEKTGVPDYNILKIKVEIWKYLDTRQKGAVVQKSQVQSMNVNVEATPEQLEQFRSVADIQAKIKELEKEMALPPAEVQAPLLVLPTERVVQEVGRVPKDGDTM